MKNVLLTLSIMTILGSCGESKKTVETTDDTTTVTPEATNKIDPSQLIRYNSVKEMLENAHDFTVEEGTLKFINEDKNKLHIQVSKPIVEGDTDKVINEIVKRDLVYVAFQVFAQTSTDKITITSIPISLENRTKYYPDYKKTLTVTRAQTDQIMLNEFGNLDYSKLFVDSGGLQIPSDNFDRLKFKDLEYVFSALAK